MSGSGTKSLALKWVQAHSRLSFVNLFVFTSERAEDDSSVDEGDVYLQQGAKAIKSAALPGRARGSAHVEIAWPSLLVVARVVLCICTRWAPDNGSLNRQALRRGPILRPTTAFLM